MSTAQVENPPKPIISVAICTHNRVKRLIYTLEGLVKQSIAHHLFEVLVIDNCSTDQTQELCSEYEEKFTYFRYIYEPVLGLSKARNTALEQAQGEYIAYLDDDAIPCVVWLEAILETFRTVQPTPVCVGGPIYGLWEISPPTWVHKYADLEGCFTVLNAGHEAKWFEPQQFPYGANMAYRRDAVRQVGGFCEQLGRKGEMLLSQEELMLNLMLEQKGERFYYSPKAIVEHWIPKERISLDWLLRRCYWQGRSEAVAERSLGKSLMKQRLESLKKLFNVKRIIAQFFFLSDIRFSTRARLWRSWGYFSQVWFYS